MYDDLNDDEYFQRDLEDYSNLQDIIDDMDKEFEYDNNISGKSTEQSENKEIQIPEMGENNKFNMIITYYDDSSNEKEIVVVENQNNSKPDSTKETKTNSEKKFNDNLLSDDNTRRRTKHLVLESTMNFTNGKIRESYNNKIGKGICLKQLIALNQKQKSSPNIDFNKEFLYKTIGEIMSDKISSKFTNFLPDHNKKLIQRLLNDEDVNKRTYFTKLFNLTFLQCLEHYRGTKTIPELKGMKVFADDIKDGKIEENYIDNLEYYLNDYESIIQNKKSRKSKKMKMMNIEHI